MKFFILAIFITCLAYVHADELPHFVYKEFPLSDASDSEVNMLIKKASTLIHPKPSEGREMIIKALKKVDGGARIEEYDYLYALYGLLKSSQETNTSNFGPGTKEDYIKVARKALSYLDKHGQVGQWVFTPQGQFKIEVYVVAGNGLAWYLYEDSASDSKSLQEALEVIEKAKNHIRGPQDYYVLDTKVRILLKLGRQKEAFKIVKKVLSEDPEFGDFQDLRRSKNYLAWLQE